ncbi:uncharacterized protein MCYG_01024 [Microsporum canis CBS 113480]|uniref:Uncharacterized protein n=1 Tax=Arthroderma otae (strain ATCC MYA-4605 / CBS 113480) TaxID=554155 RepID=C5FEA2_ARTOC|nr:uncharacterized protein MCYG_01024 [Microsporum canis CBS 113480]EEQ28136.1 predicted protein [Microsporum canis CBS 113480]
MAFSLELARSRGALALLFCILCSFTILEFSVFRREPIFQHNIPVQTVDVLLWASVMLLWLEPTPFIATPVSNRIEDFLGYATLIFNDSRAWSLENLENLVGSRLIQTMGTCVSDYLWKTN